MIMIEGYFEFTISCYLQIIRPLDTKNGEEVSNVIGFAGMILVLLLPFIMITLLFMNINTLKKESYMNRLGALYEDLKMQNKF